MTGASGGLGSGLVQLARLRGARVIAVVGPGKEDQARALGVESVVARDAENLPAAVAKAADGLPIDVVADVVGGDVFADLLNVLRPMGRYVTAGAIAGPMVRLEGSIQEGFGFIMGVKFVEDGLTFDDVLIVPRRSSVYSRRDVSLRTRLVGDLTLELPIISANMDTVKELRMAAAMAEAGGGRA